MVGHAPEDGKGPAKVLGERLDDDGEGEEPKDALPPPAQVGVLARGAVRPVGQVAGRPGQADGAEALDGDDVHPLLEVDLGPVQRAQLVNDAEQDGVDGGLVALDVVFVVDGANQAPLQAVALHVALGKEVERIRRLDAEARVQLGLEKLRGHCSKGAALDITSAAPDPAMRGGEEAKAEVV